MADLAGVGVGGIADAAALDIAGVVGGDGLAGLAEQVAGDEAGGALEADGHGVVAQLAVGVAGVAGVEGAGVVGLVQGVPGVAVRAHVHSVAHGAVAYIAADLGSWTGYTASTLDDLWDEGRGTQSAEGITLALHAVLDVAHTVVVVQLQPINTGSAGESRRLSLCPCLLLTSQTAFHTAVILEHLALPIH